MITWNMSILRWLLRKRYIHTLVRVSWYNYVCVLSICHVLLLYNCIVLDYVKWTSFVEVEVESRTLAETWVEQNYEFDSLRTKLLF